MDLVRIYGCLCDRTRLRMLHLLMDGPLCVCHFQQVLGEPQVKVSKHLGFLRREGMVVSERCANMRIYRLPAKRTKAMRANLACLQDCVGEEKVFRDDLVRLRKLRREFDCTTPRCVREPGASC